LRSCGVNGLAAALAEARRGQRMQAVAHRAEAARGQIPGAAIGAFAHRVAQARQRLYRRVAERVIAGGGDFGGQLGSFAIIRRVGVPEPVRQRFPGCELSIHLSIPR